MEIDNVPGSEHKQLVESLKGHAGNGEDDDDKVDLLYHRGNVSGVGRVHAMLGLFKRAR